MLKLKLIIVFLFVAISIWAQTATRNMDFIPIENWEIKNSLNEAIDLKNNKTQLTSTDTVFISVQFQIEEDFNAFLLHCKSLPKGSKIVLNQNQISFTNLECIDISNLVSFEINSLQISITNNNYNAITLREIIKSISIENFRGAGILFSEVFIIPDNYGHQLNIHLANFLPNDFDGKIYASILDPATYELVAENNNCAFLPSGLTPIVEIPFYKLEYELDQKKYLVELKLVDKEADEAIIDEWSAKPSFE